MSFSTSSSSYGLFPSSTCSPGGFSLFGSTSNPRDTHLMCNEFGNVMRPSRSFNTANTRTLSSKGSMSSVSSSRTSSSTTSTKSSIKKWFGFN
ncbi:photolyase [Coprinopsis cinerea AmutBmut pab1-1]|nr:photolyase [Coprinopsis cinerea AmutBmut pab1-1]